jgi:hypothetical protein
LTPLIKFTSDFVSDLLIGRNQWIGRNSARWLNEIIGCWQVAGIATWRTGLALDAVGNASTTRLAADAGVLFNGNASAVHSKIHTDDSGQIQFFADPTAALGAFSFPTGLKNGSRDTLRGPHFSNVDLGIAKNFPVWSEKYRLQFRADAFNAFNHPNFGLPDSTITNSTFGISNTLAGQEPPRVMQFSLRFDF